jgi:hypothetical protein
MIDTFEDVSDNFLPGIFGESHSKVTGGRRREELPFKWYTVHPIAIFDL